MHGRVAGSWHDDEMNTMTADKPAPSKQDAFAPTEQLPRLPVAAALLPYGLALESLLRP